MAKVQYGQSGYVGQSMSERAASAYACGEMPKSKWTKAAMLAAIEEYCSDAGHDFSEHPWEKLTKDELFEFYFYFSSWHHTGKFASETSFYSMSEKAIDKAYAHCQDTPEQIIKSRAPKGESDRPKVERVQITFEEWEQTGRSRRSGKFVKKSEYGLKFGDYVYTREKRKDAYGAHVLRIRKLEGTLEGSFELFKEIEKRLPASVKKHL